MLDGELVHNRHQQLSSFLVFDALAVQGVVQAHLPFSKRLALAEQRIQAFERYMAGFGEGKAPPCTPLVKVRRVLPLSPSHLSVPLNFFSFSLFLFLFLLLLPHTVYRSGMNTRR